MKVLIINTDGRGTGLTSLATDEKIKQIYGFAPLTIRTWQSIDKVFNTLGRVETVSTMEKIGDTEIENPRDIFVFNPPYDQLDMVVVDPVDGVFWAIKKELLGDQLAANPSTWDKLTNAAVKFFDWIGAMQIPVICTCHEKVEKRGEVDAISPFMQGTFKDQLGGYFDIILFSKAYRTQTGSSEYKWQAIPDMTRQTRLTPELYEVAKKYPSGEIPQDYKIILENIAIPNPKILVLGAYGTGKTYSLRSLNYKRKGEKKDAVI